MRNGEVYMYVGLDVHKRYCYYAMVDGRGTVVKKDRFRTTGEELDNGFLRWALVQSAWSAVHSSTPNRFQRIYQKVKARRGAKIAIVATARHLTESVYWVLTKQEAYKETKARRASSFP